MRSDPGAEVGLDDVDRTERCGGEDRVDGTAKPESRKLTTREELAGAREPGVGEHVETLEQAALGVRVEVGGVSVGGHAIAASLCFCDVLAAVGGAPSLGVVMDVAYDRGEVAVAGADMAAAGAAADAALGLLDIVERIAAERAHERFGGAGHRVLGVHRFEEQPHGAVLGACVFALLLDDRAEHLGVLAVEWMAEVTAASGVDA